MSLSHAKTAAFCQRELQTRRLQPFGKEKTMIRRGRARRHRRIRDQDREGPVRRTEPELLGAGNGRQAPITIKVAFLGSMLGPSALFNTGYRHGANGDGKEPRSVPVLRLTYCFAALVNFSSTRLCIVDRAGNSGEEKSGTRCAGLILDSGRFSKTFEFERSGYRFLRYWDV
eukprot:scaffold31226_cov32-Attheya_sp.AAC.1